MHVGRQAAGGGQCHAGDVVDQLRVNVLRAAEHRQPGPLHRPLDGPPNVVLAPHIASASLETRTRMACMAAENVIATFEGRRPANILNPEVLKG